MGWKMKMISDIELAGLPVRDVDTLIARQNLTTEFEPTVRGRRRRYTLENAIELGLVEAFRKVGLRPSEAVAYTASMLRQRRQAGGMPTYIVFADGDFATARSTTAQSINAIDFGEWFPAAGSVAVVSIRDVIGRIEAIFDRYGEEVGA